MAIVLDKWLPEIYTTVDKKLFINAFDDFIIKFHSDTITNPLFAYVDDFKIYPNANGEFEFNLKNVFKNFILFKNEYTKNLLDNELISGYYGSNNTYFFQSRFLLRLKISDGTNEEIYEQDHIYPFVSASKYLKKQYYVLEENTGYFDIYGFKDKITITKGFPFEITISRAYIILKLIKDNGDEFEDDTFSTIENKRFIITNGSETYLKKIIVKNTDETTIREIDVKVRECENAIYLKWLSKEGTFKYWAFKNKYKQERKVKQLGGYYNEFEDTYTNKDAYRSFGTDASIETILHSGNLEPYERDYIADIVDSPRVWKYVYPQYESGYNQEAFKLVELKANSFVLNDYGKNTEIVLTISEKENTVKW